MTTQKMKAEKQPHFYYLKIIKAREGEEMNETVELCCPKMQKAVDKQWVKLYTFPKTNIIAFMIDSVVLIYCPFCGEYLPEISDSFTPLIEPLTKPEVR
jgi:hypothetical protein